MKLTIEQIRAVTCGAVRIEGSNEGITFHRFTEEQEELYKNITSLTAAHSRGGASRPFYRKRIYVPWNLRFATRLIIPQKRGLQIMKKDVS